jgi:hypothetical protein
LRLQGKNISGFRLHADEDQLTETMIGLFKKGAAIPALVNIYDEKTKPRGHRAMPIYEFEKKSNLLSYVENQLKSLRRRLGLGP